MAHSSEDELPDSSGKYRFRRRFLKSLVSSSEFSVRADESEIEHGIAVSRPLLLRGPELHLKFPTNSDIKINQSVKMP